MSNIKRQLQRWQGIVPVAALVLPAAYIGILILKYGVDLPQWDEWVGVTFLYKLNAGTLSLSDLFAQQNEYRQFFPNLIFVFVGRLTKFDVRYHMGISLLTACLISFNIYHLGKLTLEHVGDRLRAYVAANLLIFSPVQNDNWLQGQQLVYFFPIACLSTCFVIATASRRRFVTRCIACAVLSIISTFSSVNGILCWLLVLPVLWAWAPAERGSKRWLVIAWIAGFSLSAILYMYGYRKPSVHPTALYFFDHPAQIAVYFFNVMGRPLTYFPLMLAPVIGFGIVAIFIWTGVQLIRRLKSPVDARRRIVWLMMGAYSLLTALLITFGRSGFGVSQSLSGRYTTFTIYLPLALVYLLTIEVRRGARGPDSRWNRVVPRLPIAAMILIQLPIYLFAVRSANEAHASQLQVKSCILLTNVIDDRCLTEKGYPSPDVFRQLANHADSLGLLRPPLIKSRNARDLATVDSSLSNADKSSVDVSQTGGHEYIASGQATFPGTGLPPDTVLLAYDDGKGDDIIFAVAFPATDRPLRNTLLGKGVDAGWRGTFDTRKLPSGPLRLTAWGFDAQTAKAYRLTGEHTIQNTGSLNQR